LPLLLLTGRWAEADELGACLPPGGWGAPRQLFTAVVLGPLARLRGELGAAWSVVRAEFPAGPATPPGDSRALIGLHLQCLATDLALDAADLPAARAWLDAHDRWLAWCGAILGSSEGQMRWARYHRLAGDGRAARRHAEAALTMARAPRQPLALLAAHRLLGELAMDGGHAVDAEHHLHAAMALAEACASPYERASTLLVLAELALGRGDTAVAVLRLVAARAIAETLGALPLLARLNALACALPAEADAHSGNTLTGREREVAALVAEGRSNRTIASALSIGERTVETHIGHILAKLGGASRAQIAAWAVEHLPK
jgi:DNA-binding CsgD family transcriptional regulator